MRRYEAMFIVDADLDETQIQKILDRYSKIITDGKGSISYAGKWEQGRRKLAYDIARRREGYYLIIQFESDAAVPKEMDRIFRISDDVFRHMIVLQNEAVPLLTAVAAEQPAEEPEPAAAVEEALSAAVSEEVAEAESVAAESEAEEPVSAESEPSEAEIGGESEPEEAEAEEAVPAAV